MVNLKNIKHEIQKIGKNIPKGLLFAQGQVAWPTVPLKFLKV